ncbi:MAG: hypothetical protein ACTSVG_06625 [Alphaproteobacteria bacterium]
MLIPRRKAPDLAVETLGHDRFDLASETPGLAGAPRFTIARNHPARGAYVDAVRGRGCDPSKV